MIVTNNSDSGAGSLRAVIAAAPSGDTITFDSGISTINLVSGAIDIAKDITIAGPGKDLLTISGSNICPAFRIEDGFQVVIKDISIKNGSGLNGGAILNLGILTVANCSITDNQAASLGGAIFSSGTITLLASTISNNAAALVGGAVLNRGTLTVSESTIADNTANDVGGGIGNEGNATIVRSAIVNNRATAGGAIYHSIGVINMINSTISNNFAFNGGGIYNTSALSISFSTLAKNRAQNTGGIITTQAINVKNSIFANNESANCSGPVSAFDINFATDNTCPGFIQVTTDELKLGPLAFNSPGITQTHALLPGSIAINAASDCTDLTGNPVDTDQRGVTRPQGAACDVGAFEFVASPSRGILFF